MDAHVPQLVLLLVSGRMLLVLWFRWFPELHQPHLQRHPGRNLSYLYSHKSHRRRVEIDKNIAKCVHPDRFGRIPQEKR